MNPVIPIVGLSLLMGTLGLATEVDEVSEITANREITLKAAEADLGGDIAFLGDPPWAIGFWHTTESTASFSIPDLPAGRYNLSMVYSGDPIQSGGVLLLTLNGRELRYFLTPTNGFKDFQEAVLGELEHPGGPATLVLRSEGMLGGAFMDLRSITVARVGDAEPEAAQAAQPSSGVPRRLRAVVQEIPDPSPISAVLLQPFEIFHTEKGRPVQATTLPPGTSVPVGRWEKARALLRHASGEYWLAHESQWEFLKLDDSPLQSSEILRSPVPILQLETSSQDTKSMLREQLLGSDAIPALILNRSENPSLFAEKLGEDLLVVQNLPFDHVESAAFDSESKLVLRGTSTEGEPIWARRLLTPHIAPATQDKDLLEMTMTVFAPHADFLEDDQTSVQQAAVGEAATSSKEDKPDEPIASAAEMQLGETTALHVAEKSKTLPGPETTTRIFRPRSLTEVFDRSTTDALLEDDFTDPKNRRFLRSDIKEAYHRDGLLVVEPGHFIALPERQIAFENFAAEIVARADYNSHRCWSVHIYGRPGPPGNPDNPHVGFRVSLDNDGTLRVLPDHIENQTADAPAWPVIEPIPVRGFRPNQFNTLTVIFNEGHKLAVFVNNLEAMEPVSVPIRLEPASVKFACCGGGEAPSSRAEFDSFRIFTGIDAN